MDDVIRPNNGVPDVFPRRSHNHIVQTLLYLALNHVGLTTWGEICIPQLLQV